MRNEFASILDYCLTEIQSGRMTMDQALASYPAQADRLREMLGLALRTRVEMAPEAADADFLRDSHARIVRAVRSSARPVHKREPARRRFAFRPAYALLVLALIVTLFGSGYGVFSASAASLPGDGLYSIKRAGEEIRLVLSFTDSGDLQLLLNLAQTRLDELQALLDAGRYDDLELALAGFDREMTRIETQQDEGEALPLKFDKLQDQLEKHIQNLERVRDQVPENAVPSIEKALDRTRHSQAVLETLSEGGRPSDLAPGLQDKETGKDKDPKVPNGNGRPAGNGNEKDKDKDK